MEADGGNAGGLQRGREIDVELAREHHLHDVERRRIGDATSGDLLRLDTELLLQRGGLRASAVNDRDERAFVDEDAQIFREDGCFSRADDLAADFDDDTHGQLPTSSSDAFSSQPRTRFMFWIA